MKNYGWLVTPLSLILLVPGIGLVASNVYGVGLIIGIVLMALGALLFFIGLSRLVQGKNPKIMGKIKRPKAAARGSAIWAFLCFNITPLVLNNSSVLNYLDGPPFPIIIMMAPMNVILLAYQWLPFVMIGFLITWLIGFILSGKIPKIYNIFNKFIITLSFSFWMNFGIQFFLWTFYPDKSDLILLTPWINASTIQELLVPILIGLGCMLLSIIFLLRMLKKLQEGFANLYVKGSNKIVIIVFLIVIYLTAISPLYFGITISISAYSYLYRYVNYVGLILTAVVAFKAITSLFGSFKKLSAQRVAEGKTEEFGTKFGISTAIYLLIFFLAWAPIILPLVDQGQNSKTNSIYNPDWNGWSGFRTALEDENYEVMCIQSSISTIAQLDKTKQTILVIPGPNIFYNPITEIPYFLDAFNSNFSMFVCDDHGTTESLLTSMFIASMGANGMDMEKSSPLTFFPKGILIENTTDSYWRNTYFPVIKDFANHQTTNGINNVVLGHATAFLGGEFLSFLGWNYIGRTSGHYSYIDVNGDGMFDSSEDVYEFPEAISNLMTSFQGDEMSMAATMFSSGFPLGGYAQAVFSTKELAMDATTKDGNGTYSSRVFCATDATWLDNELTSIEDYDNLEFGINVMNWLSCNRNPEDVIIVFDEAHIAPDLEALGGVKLVGRTEISSASSFGATQGYVNWLSTNPIFGLVYPLFALQTLRKWIPKEGKKKEIQLRDLERAEKEKSLLKFRTSSFFAKKINWYRQHKKYKQAILQLYRRIERKINRLLGDSGDRSVNAVIRAIVREKGKYISKDILKRIESFFDIMYDIKRNKKDIKDEREFEILFMEMSWVGDHI